MIDLKHVVDGVVRPEKQVSVKGARAVWRLKLKILLKIIMRRNLWNNLSSSDTSARTSNSSNIVFLAKSHSKPEIIVVVEMVAKRKKKIDLAAPSSPLFLARKEKKDSSKITANSSTITLDPFI